MTFENGKIAPEHAPPPGVYQHYKGQRYQVLGMTRHSESEEWLVIYQALYGDSGFWARPLDLWNEPVNHAEGSVVRFKLITPNGIALSSLTQHS